jgi:hypothetical protein
MAEGLAFSFRHEKRRITLTGIPSDGASAMLERIGFAV